VRLPSVLALVFFAHAASLTGCYNTGPELQAIQDTGLTGVLSEEAFKALHELKKEDAPAPLGEGIELESGAVAYLSLPEGDGPHPGIIVIHEWWGLNTNIKHWSDRLAADGYAAIAVDLYDGVVATTSEEAMKTMRSVKEDEALKHLNAAHKVLTEDKRIMAPKTGAIGWCFGGGWSLQSALNMKELDAAVIYYGRLINDPKKLRAIEAKICGVFGNLDKGIPPEVVEQFRDALTEAERSVEIHQYDANHAFANPSSARYDHESAGDAWEKVRAFLKANLKGKSKEEAGRAGG